MKNQDINIRDPFVLVENGVCYLYGTRAINFGQGVGGIDVYTSTDLENWSEPTECFNSIQYGMNRLVNWAPEVHKYKDAYYMFATFTRENGRRGTYVLKAESPMGPFVPHSADAVTPEDWECLDGTFYVGKDGKPYMVFCHEHTQILDGTICYAPMKEDLTAFDGPVTTMFAATSPSWADEKVEGRHYVTDGPFMYRSRTGELFMLWSTFIKGQYAECLVHFPDGELGMNYRHMEPLIDDDGGHGMVFRYQDQLYLTYHSPNTKGEEKPFFRKLEDCGDGLRML